MSTLDERGEPPSLEAFAELTRQGAEQPTPHALERGLDALLARIAAGKSRRRRARRWTLAGAAAGLCVVAGLALSSPWRQRAERHLPPLSYQVQGGTVLDGGYLHEAGPEPLEILFSEGTRFVLNPGARARLRSVSAEGARLAVERGSASFQVTPSEDRRWLVEVGPFVVTVKGTAFSVAWDPASERFELSLHHGRVIVSGPVAGHDIALVAGQRLVVDVPRAEAVIGTDESPTGGLERPPAHEAVSPRPAPVAPPRPGASARRAAGHEKPARAIGASPPASPEPQSAGHRWAEDVASGRWDGILADVERGGVDATLDAASSEELLAVANAARYRRRWELAFAALRAEQRRFAGSPRALDATYLLGRVEESRVNGTVRALGWYDEYLSRAPAGPYAAEALGRKMTLTNELQGAEPARLVAEEYLRRFAGGSYAAAARALARPQE